MKNIEKGKLCEDIVCNYLIDKGYAIIDRNFRIPDGEIDIIASKDSTLCAVEVKSMPKTWDEDQIVYKISPHKIFNIKKTLSIYLVNNQDNKYHEIRFDVATVADGKVNYYEGAF